MPLAAVAADVLGEVAHHVARGIVVAHRVGAALLSVDRAGLRASQLGRAAPHHLGEMAGPAQFRSGSSQVTSLISSYQFFTGAAHATGAAPALDQFQAKFSP